MKAAASRDLPAALDGYQLVGSDGGVYSSGVAASRGSTAGDHVTHPIVGGAERTDGLGYWLVTSNGTVFAFGDATSYGSATKIQLGHPIVGMTASPDGKGYWILANDGGIFAFGDAKYYGSMANANLADPIVGMASTPDGKGYWLVASNGAVFAFGDAHFYGPTGKIRFTHPIVGMAATPDGKGYWLAGNDGGVFAFGDATFFGSEAGKSQAHPIVGIAPARTGPVTGSPVLLGKSSRLGPPLTRSRPAQKSRLRRSLLFFLRAPLVQTSRLLSERPLPEPRALPNRAWAPPKFVLGRADQIMIGVTGRGRGFNLPGEPLLRKMHRSRASRNITVAGLGAALIVSILPSGAWSQAGVRGEGAAGANDVPASTVNISGFGFGHGLGMGQWGAYGYASVYHWDYKKILAHYYGGTTLGTLPSPEPPVRAHLVELDGHSTIASALSGGRLVASWGGNATFAAAALDVSRSGGGEAIFSGPVALARGARWPPHRAQSRSPAPKLAPPASPAWALLHVLTALLRPRAPLVRAQPHVSTPVPPGVVAPVRAAPPALLQLPVPSAPSRPPASRAPSQPLAPATPPQLPARPVLPVRLRWSRPALLFQSCRRAFQGLAYGRTGAIWSPSRTARRRTCCPWRPISKAWYRPNRPRAGWAQEARRRSRLSQLQPGA